MKLHYPERFYSSCAVTNISILTGWKFSTVRKKILEQRKSFRFNSKGHRNSDNYSISTEYAFLPEIGKIFRSKGINIRWKKHRQSYRNFAMDFNQGTYLVYLTTHISIVKNGMVYDNMGWEIHPALHNLRRTIVHFYAKIG